MKINHTSLFSPVFRKKFNAHKYQNIIQYSFNPYFEYMMTKTRAYKYSKLLINFLVGTIVFTNLNKGNFTHYILLGNHITYPSDVSRTQNKIPKEEREYYNWMQHEKHILDQFRSDYQH